MAFDQRSPILQYTNGQYIAEQCMILLRDTIHFDLFRMSESGPGNDATITEAADGFPVVNVLRKCHRTARTAAGLRDVGYADEIILGQSWEMPMDHRHTYPFIAWSCYELHNADGVLYSQVYTRKVLIKAHTTAMAQCSPFRLGQDLPTSDSTSAKQQNALICHVVARSESSGGIGIEATDHIPTG